MRNYLLTRAAKDWIQRMEEKPNGWYTDCKETLTRLYIDHLIYMDDDSIQAIENFLDDMVAYGCLSWIRLKGQYLYYQFSMDKSTIRAINLKNLRRFR